MGRADNTPSNSVLGNTNITGGLVVDTTENLNIYPITLQHSNIFTNSNSYGSGTVLIDAIGEDNDQPLQINRKAVSDSSFGNGANLVLSNYGTSASTASSAYDADIEFVANNPLVNAYNGKTELRQSCGRDTGTDRLRDGYFQISPRRGPLHPSGANSGFEPIFWFLPATDKGYGMFETKGNGIYVDPTYDYTLKSEIKMINVYQDTQITNQATLTGKYAYIENDGMTDSYIRNRSREGQASIYIQSETANKNAYFAMRSNWTSGSTGDCIMELMTNPDISGYRITSDDAGVFSIRRVASNVTTNVISISSASSGLMSITRTDDNTIGRIRLSNGGGTAGGGIINYNSNTGLYSFDSFLDMNITNITCKQTTPSTNNTTGALLVSGGVGVQGAINAGSLITTVGNGSFLRITSSTSSNFIQTGATASSGSYTPLYFGSIFGAVTYMSILNTRIEVNHNTQSTSTTSGALTVSGGVGISKDLFVGGKVTVTGNILPSTTETYDLGNAALEWNNIYSQNAVTVSDERKKKNIEPELVGLEFVKELQSKKYQYKATSTKSRGFIAQELEQICKKYSIEGIVSNVDDNYGVNYTQLIPILVNAIKELESRLSKLE